MASDAFLVLKGVYAHINDAIATDVYTHVPQDAAFPYVAIASSTAIPADDKTNDRLEYIYNLHSWNKNVSSFQTVMEIMDGVRLALHKTESEITIGGFVTVISRIEFEEVFQEGTFDGGDHYYHGVQRLRLIVEPITGDFSDDFNNDFLI